VPKGPKSGHASLKTRKGRASLKTREGLVQGKYCFLLLLLIEKHSGKKSGTEIFFHFQDQISLGQVPHGFLKRHNPYGFLKRHDPTLGPLAQSAVVPLNNQRDLFNLEKSKESSTKISGVIINNSSKNKNYRNFNPFLQIKKVPPSGC
jgi:hypothetical protein